MKEQPLPNTSLEDTEHSELQTSNYSWTLTKEFKINQLLVEDETTKTTDGDESFVNGSSTERNKQITPPPPPPPPPPPSTPFDSDSDSDMGHGSAHIPLYEGDEDPRQH